MCNTSCKKIEMREPVFCFYGDWKVLPLSVCPLFEPCSSSETIGNWASDSTAGIGKKSKFEAILSAE